MRRLQKEISHSKLSWPVAAAITVVLWFVAWLRGNVGFLPLALLIASGFQMMWINHIYALVRRFSRMIASSFLLFNAALLIAPDIGGAETELMWLQFCVITFLDLLFACYQYRQSQGVILYAFIMIGVASLAFKQMLLLVPLLWLLTALCMVRPDTRIWLSSCFGVLLPYIFAGCYYIIMNTPWEEQTLLTNWRFCQPFNFRGVSMTLITSCLVSSLLSAIGLVHLLREGHRDKVRTRMMYNIFMSLAVYAFLMAFIQPAFMAHYTALEIISASAMMGHFFTLTDSKESNATFIAITTGILALGVYNSLTP